MSINFCMPIKCLLDSLKVDTICIYFIIYVPLYMYIHVLYCTIIYRTNSYYHILSIWWNIGIKSDPEEATKSVPQVLLETMCALMPIPRRQLQRHGVTTRRRRLSMHLFWKLPLSSIDQLTDWLTDCLPGWLVGSHQNIRGGHGQCVF